MLDMHKRRQNVYFSDADNRDLDRRSKNHETSIIDWSPKRDGWETRQPTPTSEFVITEQANSPDLINGLSDSEGDLVDLSSEERNRLQENGIFIIEIATRPRE